MFFVVVTFVRLCVWRVGVFVCVACVYAGLFVLGLRWCGYVGTFGLCVSLFAGLLFACVFVCLFVRVRACVWCVCAFLFVFVCPCLVCLFVCLFGGLVDRLFVCLFVRACLCGVRCVGLIVCVFV